MNPKNLVGYVDLSALVFVQCQHSHDEYSCIKVYKEIPKDNDKWDPVPTFVAIYSDEAVAIEAPKKRKTK